MCSCLPAKANLAWWRQPRLLPPNPRLGLIICIWSGAERRIYHSSSCAAPVATNGLRSLGPVRGRGLFSLAQPLLSTTWLYWNWVGPSQSWEWIQDGYSWPADSANWNHPRIRGLGNFNINISAAVFVMGQERAGEMTHAWPLLNLPNTRP